MSSSYFGNVAAAAAAATNGWATTNPATIPHHHQEQFYLHQNCAKYGYSESQYYGHQYHHQHHHAGAAGPTATTPSPPFRYGGYPQPAAVSFQCNTTLAPIKQNVAHHSTPPAPVHHLSASPASSSSSSPSSLSASPSSDHHETANSSLYGFAQLDSFQQQVHHHRTLSTDVQPHHHGQVAANPLESTSNTSYDLHRTFQTNLQPQQHHHHSQSGAYCIKNANSSSYFPGWMQAYAGKKLAFSC